MPRPKKLEPYNPALAEYQRQQKEAEDAKKRDRKATDLPRNARVASMEVADPISGETVDVVRSLRNDPLANLHARKHIDEAQYSAGRAFQNDFETIQSRPQAVDASQPYVDRSFSARSISEAYSRAFDRLNNAHEALGLIGSALSHDVLIDGRSMAEVAERRGLAGDRWEKYFGIRFRECLDCLARVYGFVLEKRNG